MKLNKEKIKNLYLDIFHSMGWGVDNQTLLVDSDDENLQKRINKLDTHEHKVLGEILLTSLNRMIQQGCR